MTLSKELQMEMLSRMVRIREFENATMDVFKRGLIKGAATLYIGQEASAVGVCLALNDDDLITGTHRSHGHLLAKGAKSDRVMAEVFGKKTGYCQGRGGSMHVAALEVGCLGATGVVAAGIPIAVGAALGFKLKGENRVAASFFGEGASNTGNFHESLNMAAVWKLPVVFVLENNRYAVSTNVSQSCPIEDLSVRASSYGIPGTRVDGFDVLAVYEATVEAVERARRGEGPSLIVTESYRFDGHYSGEPEVYRSREEVNEYRKKDAIPRFCNYLVENTIASPHELEELQADICQEIEAAVAFARQSPQPDSSTAMEYIYV